MKKKNQTIDISTISEYIFVLRWVYHTLHLSSRNAISLLFKELKLFRIDLWELDAIALFPQSCIFINKILDFFILKLPFIPHVPDCLNSHQTNVREAKMSINENSTSASHVYPVNIIIILDEHYNKVYKVLLVFHWSLSEWIAATDVNLASF